MDGTQREALRLLSCGSLANGKLAQAEPTQGTPIAAAYRTLIDYLKTLKAADSATAFRMPVQSVNASGGLAGSILSGGCRIGDTIVLLPGGRLTTIRRIISANADIETAQAQAEVVITLADEFEVAPGEMLAAAQERPQVADQFAAHLVWTSSEPLLPARSYVMNINDCRVTATVTALRHRVDTASGSKLAARTLSLGQLGACNLSVARPVVFDAYLDNRDTGSFTLIDRESGDVLAVGMIDFALRRATNIHHQRETVSSAARSSLMLHRPAVLWFTGLPAAGKSTIANRVEAALHARGVHTIMLDGDNVRHGLNRDLGFTEADRVENIRRIGEVAKLMTGAGLVVLCSLISPFRADRRMVRELLGDEFIEIFVDTPLETCIARDPKGLYRRALAGEIKNFTGIDQAYEPPQHAEVHLLAASKDPDGLAEEVIAELERRKVL
jgi:bifunctional enzyme CysN/CysC